MSIFTVNNDFLCFFSKKVYDNVRQLRQSPTISCNSVAKWGLVVWEISRLVVWEIGGLVVWEIGRLVVWEIGGLVVWWIGRLVVLGGGQTGQTSRTSQTGQTLRWGGDQTTKQLIS